jgi:hypothetical protein
MTPHEHEDCKPKGRVRYGERRSKEEEEGRGRREMSQDLKISKSTESKDISVFRIFRERKQREVWLFVYPVI